MACHVTYRNFKQYIGASNYDLYVLLTIIMNMAGRVTLLKKMQWDVAC